MAERRHKEQRVGVLVAGEGEVENTAGTRVKWQYSVISQNPALGALQQVTGDAGSAADSALVYLPCGPPRPPALTLPVPFRRERGASLPTPPPHNAL